MKPRPCPIVMAGAGRPSTSCDARPKEDVDGGAMPRHDDGARLRFSVRCTPAGSGRPALDETSPVVMAGLVPAIRSGRVPRLMAKTSPAITVTRRHTRIGFLVGR